MEKIYIVSPENTTRLSYCCEIIFSSFFNVPYEIVDVSNAPESGLLCYYGHTAFANKEARFTLPSNGLLSEEGIKLQDTSPGMYNGRQVLFYNPKWNSYDLPFDLFSMVFYLITRYEEYHETPRDQFHRYQSKHSVAVLHDFIHLPLIDIWVKELGDRLNKKFGITQFTLKGEFTFQPTIDIDLPYAYKYKNWLLQAAGLVKNLASFKVNNVKSQMSFYLGAKDPYDQYEFLETELKRKRFQNAVFFFHNKYQRPIDLNHIANSNTYASLIASISKWANVGMHPSQYSSLNSNCLKEECDFISKASDQLITKSRQHYLLLHLPHTYRSLIDIGITDDFSMSYPDVLGFRASTARPFYWYDLEEEKVTQLRIHQSSVMDVTLRYYLNLTPEIAINKCREIKEEITKVKGTFCFIWHNSNLTNAYGWDSWKKVFLELLKSQERQ